LPGRDTGAVRLALAQINTTVGDIDGNASLVAEWIGRAREESCDLVLFPELTLPGYPAEDLYLLPHFAQASAAALEELAATTAGSPGIAVLVGFAEPVPGADPRFGASPSTGRHRPCAHNALALLADGHVQQIYRKQVLPNYGVFDELRQFDPGDEAGTSEVTVAGGRSAARIGLTVCEDAWHAAEPAVAAVEAGAELLVNASASPWYRGRGPEREAVFTDLAARLRRPIALCNLVGAQDGLVFEGESLVASADGEVIARAAQFEQELLVCELDLAADSSRGAQPAGREAASARPAATLGGRLEPPAEVWAGLRLGLADYAEKNGFKGVVLGLSGGIDSALIAALAADALGPDRVTCAVMPSPYSSDATQSDARLLATNLGTHLVELPIAAIMSASTDALAPGGSDGLVEENLQARIRGNLVMALSNRDGLLALSCGNKSEASVGYATLYGDMAGGLAPIKDVPKSLVYRLAEHVNLTAGRPLIPTSVIERAPSAELRPDQRDTDSLPPYDLLDRALEAHIERDLSVGEMVAEGIPHERAERVAALVRASEHKRRQAAPGIRITPKALDRDRRMPLTDGYRYA